MAKFSEGFVIISGSMETSEKTLPLTGFICILWGYKNREQIYDKENICQWVAF